MGQPGKARLVWPLLAAAALVAAGPAAAQEPVVPPPPGPTGPAEPPTVLPPLAAPAPPATPPAPAPEPPPRAYSVSPRTGTTFNLDTITMPNGDQAYVVVGGVILTVRGFEGDGVLDVEADRLVLWVRGNAGNLLEGLRSPDGQTARELEFYLAGNVELRMLSEGQTRVLRADEIYYDTRRNVAVAIKADLEFKQPGLPDPIHLRAEELNQLSPRQFRAVNAEVFSSRLPSDPGLRIVVAEATLEEKEVPKPALFGRPVGVGSAEPQRLFRGERVVIRAEDVPVFYLPFIQGDPEDPLGPLEGVNVGANRVFGFQLQTTWNVYDLFGIDPVPGTRWKLFADYLSRRGPALGTEFNYAGKELFGVPARYTGLVKAYGLYDTGKDILGGGRGEFEDHPDLRGRFLWRQLVHELPYGFSVQSQLAGLSDKNFYEQFFKQEFDQAVNQETFLYVKQQQGNWAWTALAETRLRDWVTETEWLPRADGYLLGQDFFGLLTYHAHASAGFARLLPAEEPPFPYLATDRRVETGRFDIIQELSLPFYAGPFKVAPYGVLDLAYYTEDLAGEERGRLYGGGGLRASLPLTRLYPDACSTLFNVNGLNHKIVLGGNYYRADSTTPYSELPQLDRLNDDATDQALRDVVATPFAFKPFQPALMQTGGLYDPQRLAIRRLVFNRVDTLDEIEVLQADVRQRLQTKRGYPGQQHIIDWMTLDVRASYFPSQVRDNFGEPFGFLEYDYVWNVGDRTALTSGGWFDPIDQGARVWNFGVHLNRPDRTMLYVGYREIEPIGSQALTGSVSYIFSPKYAMTASTTYDFGLNSAVSNSLVFTRMGKDLQVSLGFTYNAQQNNFGLAFEIVPNVAASSRRFGGFSPFGSSLAGGSAR